MLQLTFKQTQAEMMVRAAATILFKTLSETCPVVKLSELAESPQYGLTASALNEPVGAKFVRITDLKDGGINWETVPYCQCEDPEKYALKPGDILFARTGATTGKTHLVQDVKNAVFASYLIRLRPQKTVSAKYLYSFFQSDLYWAQILEEKQGSAQPNVNGQKLINICLPLVDVKIQEAISNFLEVVRKRQDGSLEDLPELPPPIAQQRQIVARIEELAAKIEEARGLRKRAIEETDILISRTRAGLFDEALKSSCTRFDDVAVLERGKFSHRPRNDPRFFGGSHPWIQIAEIESSGKFITEWHETLNDEGLAISRKFSKGTLLISIAATIGAVGILEFDCCIPDSIVAVTPKQGIDSEYLYHYLGYLRTNLEKIAPQSAQKNINLRILEPLPIPALNLSKQHQIVAYLDSLQAKVDQMKQSREYALKEFDALLPAILDKAFKGEL